jgi:hypothetical protein
LQSRYLEVPLQVCTLLPQELPLVLRLRQIHSELIFCIGHVRQAQLVRTQQHARALQHLSYAVRLALQVVQDMALGTQERGGRRRLRGTRGSGL